MTRPSDTEAAIAQVLRENGIVEHPTSPEQAEEGIHSWRCGYPDTYGNGPCTCFAGLVEDLAALAGAGAQVTEAADLEAIAQEIERIPTADPRYDGTINRHPFDLIHDAAHIVRSAALPHMGTGQSEADLREMLETELVRNEEISEELCDLLARISALADEWVSKARMATDQANAMSSDRRQPYLIDSAKYLRRASELRALLDRPAAAEGNETP